MDQPESEHKWLDEAKSVIHEIYNHVKSVCVSNDLPNDNTCVFLNITTLEEKAFCVRLTGIGFQVIAGDIPDKAGMTYETPFSLLSDLSPLFVKSFGSELQSKLFRLFEVQDTGRPKENEQ